MTSLTDTTPAAGVNGEQPTKAKGDPAKFADTIVAEFADASAGIKAAILDAVTRFAPEIASPGGMNAADMATRFADSIAAQRQVSQALVVLRSFARIAQAAAGLSRAQIDLVAAGIRVGLG